MRGWSLGAGGLCVLLAGLVVVSEMATALLGVRFEGPAVTPLDWWAMLAAIVLVGVRVGLVPLDSRLFGSLGAEGVIVCLELTALTVLWWLGVEELAPGRVGAVCRRLFSSDHGAGHGRDRRVEPATGSACKCAGYRRSFMFTLSILSALFTLGRENPTTVATLVLIALAAGHWAVAVGELRSAYLGSLAWSTAGFVAGLVVARATRAVDCAGTLGLCSDGRSCCRFRNPGGRGIAQATSKGR